ncbi:prefoldin subunit alpha [Candidatus Woesearchaeota archaeon]|nr:prefoldin subunit alpha [Candidatus Woesearchaeota archaeon]
MKDKKEMQHKIIEYQLLQQHIENLQQQGSILNQQNLELSKLSDALTNLENSKQDRDIFSQIGQGIFVKAVLKDTKEILFNVGSDIFINKKVKEASLILENQQREISESLIKLEEQLRKAISRILELQEEIQNLKE